MSGESNTLSGPGILFVNSKITSNDILSEEVFFQWYNEDHVPEVVALPGVHAAWRYISTDKKADRPYYAAYKLPDISYLATKEFNSVAVNSPILPGSGLCFDLANFDVRFYKLVQSFEPLGTKPGPAPAILVAHIEPGDKTSEEDFDSWYRQEHLKRLDQLDGYRRTTRYKLIQNYENQLEKKDMSVPTPPRFLALHEWESSDIPFAEIQEKVNDTEWTKRILGDAKAVKGSVITLHKSFGPAGESLAA